LTLTEESNVDDKEWEKYLKKINKEVHKTSMNVLATVIFWGVIFYLLMSIIVSFVK